MATTNTPPWTKRNPPLNDPANRAHETHTISTNGYGAKRIWEPEIELPTEIQDKLKDYASTFRRERCGFISADFDIWNVENVHLHPENNYYFDPEDTGRVVHEIYEIRESSILGQFHTHPTGIPWPSPRDIAGWPNPELGWKYWIATPREVIEWELFMP